MCLPCTIVIRVKVIQGPRIKSGSSTRLIVMRLTSSHFRGRFAVSADCPRVMMVGCSGNGVVSHDLEWFLPYSPQHHVNVPFLL